MTIGTLKLPSRKYIPKIIMIVSFIPDNLSLAVGSGGGSGAGGEPIEGDVGGVARLGGLGAALLGGLAFDPMAYSLENNDFGGYNNTSSTVSEGADGRTTSDDWSSWYL